jgi:hypothetical protein
MSKVTITVAYGDTEIEVSERQIDDFALIDPAIPFPESAWRLAIARVERIAQQ